MLHELLAENRRRFHNTYDGGLTNHLPMCLGALRELGADDERLRTFFDVYAQRLEPAVPVARVELHGDRARAIGDVLARAAPKVASGAFHGIIRLAWAVDCDDDDDVARALYDLAGTLEDPPPPPGAGHERSLLALAGRLRSAGVAAPPGRLLSTRLQGLAADAAFAAVVDDLAGDIGIDDIATFGARLFSVSDDFASLHVITGADALMTLAPFSTRLAESIHAAAAAALGCFVLAGCPALDELEHDVDEEATIARRACASDDDHVCKFVASCLRHARRTGDPLFLALATRTARRGVT